MQLKITFLCIWILSYLDNLVKAFQLGTFCIKKNLQYKNYTYCTVSKELPWYTWALAYLSVSFHKKYNPLQKQQQWINVVVSGFSLANLMLRDTYHVIMSQYLNLTPVPFEGDRGVHTHIFIFIFLSLTYMNTCIVKRSYLHMLILCRYNNVGIKKKWDKGRASSHW